MRQDLQRVPFAPFSLSNAQIALTAFVFLPGAGDIRDAVNLVADAARSVQTSDLKLPTGGIAFVDNHNALHGRSRFSDAGRHLIRVRGADRVTGG